MKKEYLERIFAIGSKEEFTLLALEAFGYQREHCKVYREYLRLTGRLDFQPESIEEITFLPISLFKSQDILSTPSARCGENIPLVFTSSATTGMTPSHHIIVDPAAYERSFREGFRRVYGEAGTYNLLALLPSYLERKGSSLVYMADHLIKDVVETGGEGGFYLYDHDRLLQTLRSLHAKRKTILLGVSFALLDFAKFVAGQIPDPEERKTLFSDVIVIETGGMKGRGEELSREELHGRLKDGFVSARIDSEYGMCELLSQAYSVGNMSEGLFFTPPWMRVLARDLQDPFRVKDVTEGGLNIIDLANINSCCFIETEDQGRLFPVTGENRSVHPPFTVDGRIQNSELRGCNMLLG